MLKLAVVGAGIMGAHHCRIAASLPDVELAYVVDPDEVRGRALADNLVAHYLPDIAELAGRVDAAILAAPSEFHADLGVRLFEAGLDVLVEKPIAMTVEESHRLIDAAARHDRILMVGHVERFNPAVVELQRLVDDLIHVDIRRVGPFSPRISSDVVLDLMIHDVDILRTLVRSELSRVYALSSRVHSDTGDFATVLLRFANGVSATLTASRASQTKQRTIELTQRKNLIVADLLRRQVTIHRVEHDEFVDEAGARYRQNGVIEIPYLEGSGEPLAMEQRHFLDCVRNRTVPRVTGEDGLAALKLALRIRNESMTEDQHV
jgi:predicted dehydrogenase